MERKKSLIVGMVFSLVMLNSAIALSQEEQATQPAKIAEMQQQQPEPDVQWVWGEVSTVDAQNKALTLKYLDYETDQEKEITISADAKTTYENIKAFEEIKPKDSLSVDYFASLDGKNIAKNISLEQLDLPPVPETLANVTPAEETPAAGAAAQ